MKPLRPCRKPGCPELTRNGWCPKHIPKPTERSAEAKQYRRWYSLPIWTDDLRPNQLLNEPFCRECAKLGERVYATHVDHVEDHKGNWEKFIDQNNLQSLCHRCHSRKTMRDLNKNRRNL